MDARNGEYQSNFELLDDMARNLLEQQRDAIIGHVDDAAEVTNSRLLDYIHAVASEQAVPSAPVAPYERKVRSPSTERVLSEALVHQRTAFRMSKTPHLLDAANEELLQASKAHQKAHPQ